MLHHSLFTRWLKKNGMETDKKDESTKDVICIDFQFGLRSYAEEISHLKKMRKEAGDDEEKLQTVDYLEERVNKNKDLYKKISKDDIRRIFYTEGVPITYRHTDKKTGEIISETINYKMLYRNPSKAKQGSCMFIREELYDKAYDWLTMGLGPLLPEDNAKIVEISAYAPLSTSAIDTMNNHIGLFHIDVKDVLILEDQDSFFRTIADVVKTDDYEVILKSGKKKTKKKCIVERKEVDVKNTLWDGMALLESSVMPDWCNGMALLRNHFFKACGFRTNIQKFFHDYCSSHGIDYDTYEIDDMFGNKILAKNIKMIVSDNGIKWKKFIDLMGGTPKKAYKYWCKRVRADGCVWGIVKTDHPSKFDNVQRLSYQMINTLPCSAEDIEKIAQTSIDYVNQLKTDNDLFEKFLRRNATEVNHYEMLADLYDWNHDFSSSKMWKNDKSNIISKYVRKLKRGKITVEGDNITVCGNPYALLLYTVGESWEDDPTLRPEDGVVQVYAPRFKDGEYLCGIRNPHNSANNLGYFKNVIHPLMEKYFEFSNNIMAVNCIHTDVQARMNGEDFDSDFNFVTNQPEMVKAAKIAYEKFPTVVNEVPESGMTYHNTMKDYAIMDSKMQSAQKAIGGSSDVAQLSQSYYWDNISKGIDNDDTKQYYENTVILAVCAQLAIDGCKKVFTVDVNDDIARIRSQPCMKKERDYPEFIKWTREIPVTKNGKERPQKEISNDRKKLFKRIDSTIDCPMNQLIKCLDKIQGMSKSEYIETEEFFINKPGRADKYQTSKIRKLVDDYDSYIRKMISLMNTDSSDDIVELMNIKTEETIESIRGMKMSEVTMNRLIATAIGIDKGINNKYKYVLSSKCTSRLLNLLYKANKQRFLSNFVNEN